MRKSKKKVAKARGVSPNWKLGEPVCLSVRPPTEAEQVLEKARHEGWLEGGKGARQQSRQFYIEVIRANMALHQAATNMLETLLQGVSRDVI